MTCSEALAMSPYNLMIYALKVSDIIAKIQRALVASSGVPLPRLLSKLAYLTAADGIGPKCRAPVISEKSPVIIGSYY